jgi:MFS family permease
MAVKPKNHNKKNHKGQFNKFLPAPMRRPHFRRLWIGMASSYAGDRFQQLAQSWLVAIITRSALAVGWIGILGSIPLVLMPMGGVIADQVDRRRLLITWQIVGAIATVIIAILVWFDRISVWQIYVWSVINGLIALFSRPAYKVFLTEVVPPDEVRPAVSINSMTETSSMILVNLVGSFLLDFLGLVLAFIMNSFTFFIAVGYLWGLKEYSQNTKQHPNRVNMKRVIKDMKKGIQYLSHKPAVLHPLLLTFITILVGGPIIGLLAAIVEKSGGTIVDMGLLSAAGSLGALGGAAFAGYRSAGKQPTQTCAILGLISASAIAAFALLPTGTISMIPFGVLGAATFSQAVWNTSRVAELVEPIYQGRLQALTSMAFNLGFSLSMFWGGAAIDKFGLAALVVGAALLGFVSLFVLLKKKSTSPKTKEMEYD